MRTVGAAGLVLVALLAFATFELEFPHLGINSNPSVRWDSTLDPVFHSPQATDREIQSHDAGPDSADALIAALPAQSRGLRECHSSFQALESALLRDPASVLPRLLERYSWEVDPVLKGLFAVLLAVDRSTHP